MLVFVKKEDQYFHQFDKLEKFKKDMVHILHTIILKQTALPQHTHSFIIWLALIFVQGNT